MKTVSSITLRQTSLLLTICICLSCFSPVTQATRNSNYISSYSAAPYAAGNGKVTIYFDITGTAKMDKIGSTLISIYENGLFVKSYSSTSTPSMIADDTNFHCSSVTYSGVAGRSHYAVVKLYAGKNGGGDSRTYTTKTITAT